MEPPTSKIDITFPFIVCGIYIASCEVRVYLEVHISVRYFLYKNIKVVNR